MKKKKLNKKGFTLVELLATLAVLSLVSSIVIYFSNNALKKGRETTYLTTVNEIEKAAGNYLSENSKNNELFFIPVSNSSDTEHQCVRVKDLVDYGYLSDDITESVNSAGRNVDMDDKVYVLRNSSTKTVLKKVYITDSSSAYAGYCGVLMSATSSIRFLSEPSAKEWSKSKKITIEYRVKNPDVNGGYSYLYGWNGNSNGIETIDSDNITTKIFNVSSVGSILAWIQDKDGNTVGSSVTYDISKIDTVAPTMNSFANGIVVDSGDNGVTSSRREISTSEGNNYTATNTDVISGYEWLGINGNVVSYANNADTFEVSKNITFSFKVSDFGIGVDREKFVREGVSAQVGDYTLPNSYINVIDKNKCTNQSNYEECEYEISIINDRYNGRVKLKILNGAIKDKLGNSSLEYDISTNIIFNNKYSISLQGNGATNGNSMTKSVEVTYGASTTSPSSITLPVRKYVVSYDANSTGVTMPASSTVSYVFNGWTYDSAGDKNVMSNSTNPSFVANVSGYTDESAHWIRTSNATLYANWTEASLTLPTKTKSGYSCAWRLGSASGDKYEFGSTYVPTGNTKFYLDCTDSSKPLSIMTVSAHFKQESQTVSLSCRDNVSINGYYFGTTKPNNSYSNISFTNVSSSTTFSNNVEVDDAGDYYFVCRDGENNKSSTEKVSLKSYVINNALLNVSGSKGNYYDSNNYTVVSSYAYIIPSDTSMIVKNLYTIPKGSEAAKYRGYSVGAPTTTSSSLSSNSSFNLGTDNTYTMWFYRNEIHFRYKVNNGEVLKSTTSSSGTIRSWSTDDAGLVYVSVNSGSRYIVETTIRYGASSMDLLNWNNAGWLYITKTGYSAVSDAQWMCVSGCITSNQTFSHSNVSINGTDSICNAKNGDCTIVLKVNWQANSCAITYDANGGNYSPNPTTYTYAESGTVKLSDDKPTRNGYKFKKWIANSTGVSYNPGDNYNKNGVCNETLKADWEYAPDQINDYRCTYDSNGNETHRYFITTCDGSNANCNYTKDNGSNVSGTVVRNTLRYCRTKITYDCATNGGSGTTNSWYSSGALADLNKTCTVSGRTFIGWNTNKDATSKLPSYTVGSNNATLYAIYSRQITVTFSTAHGNSNCGVTLSHSSGTSTSTLNVSCTAYNRGGCGITTPAISGAPYYYSTKKDDTSLWDQAPSGVTHWWQNASTASNLTENKTFYVVCGKHTMTFNKNTAASIGYTSATCVYAPNNPSCSVSSPTINAGSNKTAIGWNTNKNATTSTWKAGEPMTISSSGTYYAITKNTTSTYKVYFYRNSGTWTSSGWSGNPYTATYSSTLSLTNRVKRSGYAFAGWGVGSANSGTTYYYYVDATDNNKSLYAKWKSTGSDGYTGSCYCKVNSDCVPPNDGGIYQTYCDGVFCHWGKKQPGGWYWTTTDMCF